MVEKAGEKIHEAMNELNSKTASLIKASEKGGMKVARAKLRTAHHKVLQELDEGAEIYKKELSAPLRRILRSSKRLEKFALRKGILVNDLEGMGVVEKIATTAKVVGKGCIALSVALGVDKVYNTYKKGGDWEKKAAGITTELAVIALTSAEIFSLFTPVGWVAILGAAIVEGVIISGIGLVAEKGAEVIYQDGENVTHWAEKEIKNWL